MKLILRGLMTLLPLAAQTNEKPVRAVTDPGVVTTRQAITPAGTQAVFQGRVHGIAFGASADELWVLNAGQVFRLDWRNNRVLDRVAAGGSAGLQGIRFDRESGRAYVSCVTKGRVRLLAVADGRAGSVADDLGGQMAGSVSLAKGIAVVALTFDNKLAIVDTADQRVRKSAVTGVAPFAAAVNAEGTVAYVSNWGGRLPKQGDLTAATGLSPAADQVVVDARGIASTGSVARVDLASGEVTHTIATGLHPTAILWDETRNQVYVANANSDSVSVIDTRSNRVAQTFALQPFGKKLAGIAPTSLALSRDGGRLFVACGGFNAVAVVDTGTGALQGMIPTAWYPDSLALSADDKYLAVGTLLGPGSGWREEPRKRFVHANRGSVAVLPVPDAAQLASYTGAVAENNRLTSLDAPQTQARNTTPAAVPFRSGDASLIQHVVYIIKENRTYDQVLGDLAKGNGDPSLVMFGEDVTPNQHRLADQFVVLDNFYASGGNSADGHQWVTQANEVAYCMWPGYAGRSYPFDGSDPIAYAQNGFIWDVALAQKKTVRVYGEYAGRTPAASRDRHALLERWKNGDDFARDWQITAPIAPAEPHPRAQLPRVHHRYPRRGAGTHLPGRCAEMGSRRRHAEPRAGAVAVQSYQRNQPRLVERQGDGRGQRPGFGTDRRSPEPHAVLEVDGDFHRGGRCAERRGSRGRPPDRGAPGEPLCAARTRGFHLLLAPEHPQNHRADVRAAGACRCST